MKKIPFIVLGIILGIFVVLMILSPMIPLEYIQIVMSYAISIAIFVFLTVITYCVIGIYINGKKK